MNPDFLVSALRTSVGASVRGEKVVAVAYSGGLDSSLISALSSELTETHRYTCAVMDSYDAKNAEALAREEGQTTSMILLGPEDIPGLVSRTASAIRSTSPVQIAYSIPVVCVLERAREGLVLAGNGADEIFGGYAKYVGVTEPEVMMARDLAKALAEAEGMRTCALRLGKTLEFPFLSDEIVRLASEITTEEKISSDDRKVILRAAARSLGLASEDRKKRAAQYSSGVLRCMERLAKAEGLGLPEWIGKLTAAFQHGQSH